MITKQQAFYTISQQAAQCANCVMFSAGSCDLVLGLIEPYAVCAHWEPDPGDVQSVAQHIALGGANGP